MDAQEMYLAEHRKDEILEGYWCACAGERVLMRSRSRWEAICYCDGYNNALHDFVLPPSIYDEVEDEDDPGRLAGVFP